MNIKKIIITIVLMFSVFMPLNVNALEIKNISRSYTVNMIEDNDLVYFGAPAFNEEDWKLCNGVSESSKKTLGVLKFLGRILKVVFIAIPIILIIMGSIDFTKAVMAGKEDDIKKSQNAFVKRIIAAVILFFVPIIVSIVMNFLNYDINNKCVNCVLNPTGCTI